VGGRHIRVRKKGNKLHQKELKIHRKQAKRGLFDRGKHRGGRGPGSDLEKISSSYYLETSVPMTKMTKAGQRGGERSGSMETEDRGVH